MQESHSHKTVLVTGSAVRIGRAIAVALGRKGYQIAVHYNRSKEEAVRTVAEIQSEGGVAHSFQADLSQPLRSVPGMCQSIRAEFGGLDVLINNASLFEEGLLLDTTEESWDRQFAVNLQAPFVLSQEFVRGLADNSHGHIINICDWRGETHPPGHDAYTLSKAGLVALTHMLASELAPRIQVNGIHPGAILPPPNAHEDHDRRAKESIPLNRTGSPEDIVIGVLYLLQSSFVTGEILNITGGEHLG
ncbi:MAG: SDR family oxidoreductase [Planctomycetaceae bacterium]|jgi:pteridine reductase|nr:SDR family oxidoreductase [Planctomycetaceae bacterium]MDG2388238.1 SDR family oxidoreductase [Planctomycetaceae bacterium]